MIICAAENSVLKELAALLPEALHAAAAGFRDSRRSSYLASRALLYLVVQHFFEAPEPYPAVAVEEQGKPFFRDYPQIKFNLTHSRGFAAVAVAAGATAGTAAGVAAAETIAGATAGAPGGVAAGTAAGAASGTSAGEQGIDLEFVRKYHDLEALKKRVLGARERGVLEQLQPEEQRREFTALWTVRECLLKASGRGLAGLDELEVDSQLLQIKSTLNAPGFVHCLEFPLAAPGTAFLSWFRHRGERAALYAFTPDGFEQLPSRGERVFTVLPGSVPSRPDEF